MIAFTLRIGTALTLLATGVTAASARQHSHSGHRHAALHVTQHQSRHHHRYDIARHDRVRYHHADDAAGVSRSCLTPDTRSILDRVEAAFGPVQIVSTCRPGAVVAGTGHPSQHRYGRAVDFNAPAGKKAAVVQWLIANNPSGGTMTYADMGHIHMDTGPRHFVSLGSGSGGGARHQSRRAMLARRVAPTSGAVAAYGRAEVTQWGPTGTSEAVPQRRRYAHHRHATHVRG
jgi:uncharacterized protein YcbK (DUF882 family)